MSAANKLAAAANRAESLAVPLHTAAASALRGEWGQEGVLSAHSPQYGDREWSLLIDDPSGMSFIEPNGSVESDAQLTVEEYERTAEQQQMLSGA